MKVRVGPNQNRASHCTFTEADALRLRRIIVKHGSIKRARESMGLGNSTMESARACGRTTKPTYERVLDAMTKEEAAA